MTDTDTPPPIPASLADRPVRGGLVLPWVNVELAGGGADFRTAHRARAEQAWTEGLCQSCGGLLTDRCVLLCGPRQLLSRRFDEPPACPPCALYAGQACPMIAGRMTAYADRARVSEGHRGGTCPDPGCGCGGWVNDDPRNSADYGGDPAHPWYALWVIPHRWQLTGHKFTSRCSDLGCEHERMSVDGAILLMDPLKITLASEPGNGRIWRTLGADEASEHASGWLERLGLER